MRNGLRFGLLGPLVLYDADGEFRPIGSGKMRALLATLLLEPGRVVSVDVLKDALWGGAPPASAQASLQNHVTRLRRLLDDPERLRAIPPGYVLRVGEGELDVRVFERHATAARAAHAERDWERALRESLSAIALWRGTPLSGLPYETGGHAFVQRLEEARLLVLEWRYEAELRLSDLGEAQARLGAARQAPPPSNWPRSARAGGPPSPDRPTAEGGAPSRSRLRSHGENPHRGPSSDTSGARTERRGNVPELPGGRSALTTARLDRLAPELAALTAEHPFREAFHRLLMLVLHRTGRQAEALAVHRDLRARLVEELGIEPGPAVREAHLEILREQGGRDRAADVADDAGRAEREAAAVPSDPGPPRPAQLPPPPAYFTGRDDLRQELRLALDPERRTTGSGVAAADGMPCVAVISGMAGVGKSALALHVAHGLRERFPDGQLYVNLHGATPGMTPLTSGQALAALLRDLGAEPRRIPEHRDAAAALLRSMLAPTRTLMVLDDAAHAAQVRPLLPAGAGCAVIVTSRSPLTALDGAHRFPLAPLSDEDSAALLRAVSGRRNGLDGGHPLVELTGRLPLALRVVAARLAARHALTPDMLAGQLAATEGRLHHLEYDDLSVRRSLAVAHDALRASEREADRDAALALCRIGALDLPAYGAPLLARLSGIDERRAEAALDRLVDVALLEETAYGRYAPHDLVRDFAREIAGATRATEGMATSCEGPDGMGMPDLDGHDAAVAERALRWYAGVAARSLEAILEPGLDREDRSRPTASQPERHTVDAAMTPPFCTAKDAFAWGDLELENVVALVEHHAETSPYVPVLVRLLNPYVQRSGRVAELELLQRAALGAARRLGDEAAEAYALGDLAGLHFMTGRASDALVLNDEALAIWRRLGVLSWVRRGLNNRGMLLEGLGRYTESGEALLQSLEFSRELGDPHMEAITYSHLGNLYEHTDPRAAIDHHKRSLAIGDTIRDVIIRHSAHCNIGYAHLALGEPAAAVPHFEESLRILGSHGDWHGESQTRLGLVRALRGVGHEERAARECDLLLCRADRRADRYTGGLARHQRGLLLRSRGDLEGAYEQWESALAALAETDSPVVGELRELLAEKPERAS
ncbi:SARP family transcriptional regulator [Streptomyces albiflavescens]|uniref:SARP family transcriptional regulator n=1 Tax=Streptomyces albiflavescens TaxID=1623582 RepID=A0A918D639_9ACTN|nr:AfsR/SARP family transcriptional regulator [Streptomyces albiflavescens]GGN74132.1 SARP family transcriptional regulator [Streptomyces albiflavescens]